MMEHEKVPMESMHLENKNINAMHLENKNIKANDLLIPSSTKPH